MKLRTLSIACASVLATSTVVAEDVDIGKLFVGDHRVQQDELYELSLQELRLAGLRMFTNPFTKDDGFGDGDKANPSGAQGDRGSLQGNGTFQRIGGLDAQTCLECHSVISRRKVPFTTGIGGVGGVNNNVLGAGGNTFVNLTTPDKKHNIDGRVINPPFIFGAGSIELLANEMTLELQAQKDAALAGPDGNYPLSAKGVSFGSLTIVGGAIQTDGLGNAAGAEGTANLDPTHDDFLVVQPFGRKGNEKSTRTFDIGALSFHFGMGVSTTAEDAAVVFESYGETITITDPDHDSDGVENEVTQGELSALSVLVGSAQRPFQTKVKGNARLGRQVMDDAGCTQCHIPKMETNTREVGFRFPEVSQNPLANVHTTVDLTKAPMEFEKNDNGGITVELFADLKRHYMGPSLEEFDNDGMFTTMRLWGVADTAPYLHDGRALTIRDAIVLHGADATSEAFDAVNGTNGFNNRSAEEQEAVLAFLDTLRVPDGTFPNLLGDVAVKVAKKQGVYHHGHH